MSKNIVYIVKTLLGQDYKYLWWLQGPPLFYPPMIVQKTGFIILENQGWQFFPTDQEWINSTSNITLVQVNVLIMGYLQSYNWSFGL